MTIDCIHSKHLGAFKNVRDRTMRIATIGRTFLDMLTRPEKCGGINHVLSVYEEFGVQYLPLIVDELEAHGAPIDKVRAGYIFNEVLNINDNATIESWVSLAQRGGSRKLDSSEEYLPKWPDKWKISINI
jgi:predicted transcriptional regulator of viral defense system